MKKIKDYLHLYFGCECEVSNVYNYGHHLETLTSGILNSYYSPAGYIGNIKPLLRPLSDMTEEEIIYTVKFFESDMEIKHESVIHAVKEMKDKGIDGIVFNEYHKATKVFEYFLYLLKQHFDLFGLIESGLAIEVKESKHQFRNR